MFNLKKTAIAVFVLGSGAAVAGSMGPVCSSVNVTIPCESSAWSFGADALYLQPLRSSSRGTFGTTANGREVNFPNNYAWGFKLEGSYHYGTGSDTNLNWYHVNKSATKSANINDPIAFDLTGAHVNAAATASVDPKWDAVNLEFGQLVNFGEHKSIRLHGGAQYARVADSLTFNSVDTANAANHISLTDSPTYNGFGPRVGADMNYDWGNGLGIYANGAGGLLAGTTKYNANSTAVDAGVGYASSVSSSRTSLVPELEAKLGIKYDYAMAQGDLTLDVGWMWINYFNAETSSFSGVNSDSDFGLQGLYFGLKWLGNVA